MKTAAEEAERGGAAEAGGQARAPTLSAIRERLDGAENLELRSKGADPERAAELYRAARERQTEALRVVVEDDKQAKKTVREAVKEALRAFEEYGNEVQPRKGLFGRTRKPNYQKASEGLQNVVERVSDAFTRQKNTWRELKERVGQTYTIINELHDERSKAALDRDGINAQILELASARDGLERWLSAQPDEVTANVADTQREHARLVSHLSELTRYQRMLTFHIENLGLEIEKHEKRVTTMEHLLEAFAETLQTAYKKLHAIEVAADPLAQAVEASEGNEQLQHLLLGANETVTRIDELIAEQAVVVDETLTKTRERLEAQDRRALAAHQASGDLTAEAQTNTIAAAIAQARAKHDGDARPELEAVAAPTPRYAREVPEKDLAARSRVLGEDLHTAMGAFGHRGSPAPTPASEPRAEK